MIFGVLEMKYMKITQVTLHELQGFDPEIQMLVLMSFPGTPQSPKSRGGALSLMRFPSFVPRIGYNCSQKVEITITSAQKAALKLGLQVLREYLVVKKV